MRFLGRIGLIGVLMVLGAACAGESGSTESDGASQGSVPEDWFTYDDEISGFRLSFPGDWVVTEIDEDEFHEFMNPIVEGTDLESLVNTTTSVFAAGAPTDAGEPNVNITLEALAEPVSAEAYASAAATSAEAVAESWETTSLTKSKFGDREGSLSRASYLLSEFLPDVTEPLRFWMVQGYATDDRVAWVITCGKSALREEAAAVDLETCETVVRSFRLTSP